MGGPLAGVDRLAMEAVTRFVAVSRGQARALLAAIAALMVLAAIVCVPTSPGEIATPSAPAANDGLQPDTAEERDADLALYDAITERVAAGENYYHVAVEEQRARSFPVRPGFAVRLPTLATASAALGETGVLVAGALLALLTFWAWWRRLTPLLERPPRRIMALGLLAVGAAVGFKPTYFVLHEAWSGMLIALALALHRPGKWRGAWVAAALALAIREHALPFVLLMGAMAAWRRDWRETFFWGLLVLAFGSLLWTHVQLVGQITGPDDPLSPGWLTLRGASGWIELITLSTGLYMLPTWLAGPLVLLPLIGWAALNDRLGLTAALLFAGYGLLFMIAGRANNFYWGLMVTPAWFIGLYWVPGALRDLWRRARAPSA